MNLEQLKQYLRERIDFLTNKEREDMLTLGQTIGQKEEAQRILAELETAGEGETPSPVPFPESNHEPNQ